MLLTLHSSPEQKASFQIIKRRSSFSIVTTRRPIINDTPVSPTSTGDEGEETIEPSATHIITYKTKYIFRGPINNLFINGAELGGGEDGVLSNSYSGTRRSIEMGRGSENDSEDNGGSGGEGEDGEEGWTDVE